MNSLSRPKVPRVVVLSGRVCAGKSSLARNLEQRVGARVLKSKALLEQVLKRKQIDRKSLQRAGEKLDKETEGKWLSAELNKLLMSASGIELVVIDAVRIENQIKALRHSGWPVVHIHLTAERDELARRYSKLSQRPDELKSYDDLSRSKTEKSIEDLAKTADVVINTNRCNLDDVYARVVARLEVRPVIVPPLVDVLVGGQYGSEGKGNIANHLAPEYDVLVRVGGPNAGHKVFRRDQEPFTFHQLPSGALANKEAKLVIGAGAVISLEALRNEISKLSIEMGKLIIDHKAMIIEKADIDWEVENLRNAIASTAQGDVPPRSVAGGFGIRG